GDDAFAVNVSAMSKEKDVAKRQLPVYICDLGNKGTKYILPVYGAGLWGPIWGYIALDSDGSTIYGAYFAHQGETPGLGAEIEKPAFSDQFDGKQMFKNDQFLPVAVVKRGQKAPNGEDYVDAVSGGTITSKGVSQMLTDCLKPYEAYLETLHNK
ncbi:MAG: NADH:ubiquinone reductase (Na(+)-transporting) subunit C, partial [Muribaculaceae bacterium]|nr:NADH:ubiquinone reductase (Na(+)-transporting) subunit C [Muribaculaceae bacterium]